MSCLTCFCHHIHGLHIALTSSLEYPISVASNQAGECPDVLLNNI